MTIIERSLRIGDGFARPDMVLPPGVGPHHLRAPTYCPECGLWAGEVRIEYRADPGEPCVVLEVAFRHVSGDECIVPPRA